MWQVEGGGGSSDSCGGQGGDECGLQTIGDGTRGSGATGAAGIASTDDEENRE
jgi:hypothetical protein